jgi:hypothetical protein
MEYNKSMNRQREFQMDKTAFSVVSLAEADDEFLYWQTKTPQERLRAVELIRQTLYGYSDPAPRLQRVFTTAQCQES